jgi:hypothetical protein
VGDDSRDSKTIAVGGGNKKITINHEGGEKRGGKIRWKRRWEDEGEAAIAIALQGAWGGMKRRKGIGRRELKEELVYLDWFTGSSDKGQVEEEEEEEGDCIDDDLDGSGDGKYDEDNNIIDMGGSDNDGKGSNSEEDSMLGQLWWCVQGWAQGKHDEVQENVTG